VYSVKIEEGNVCLEMVNFRAARKDRYAEGLGSSQSSSIMASSDYNEHRQRAQGMFWNEPGHFRLRMRVVKLLFMI